MDKNNSYLDIQNDILLYLHEFLLSNRELPHMSDVMDKFQQSYNRELILMATNSMISAKLIEPSKYGENRTLFITDEGINFLIKLQPTPAEREALETAKEANSIAKQARIMSVLLGAIAIIASIIIALWLK